MFSDVYRRHRHISKLKKERQNERKKRISGNNNIDEIAWRDDALRIKSGIHEVSQKKANELGIYDMSGNVCEWCSDSWHRYSSESQRDPIFISADNEKVIRGGGWYSGEQYCRVVSRESSKKGDGDIGMRLVLSVK